MKRFDVATQWSVTTLYERSYDWASAMEQQLVDTSTVQLRYG